MRVLIPGSEGKDVRRWQLFLMGQGFAPLVISGAFDAPTVQATRAFQARYKLDVDGKVSNQTLDVGQGHDAGLRGAGLCCRRIKRLSGRA